MFSNIQDAITWVVTQTKFREKTNLDIMNQAYLKLDIKLNHIKKVHVAGTNGKGSTTAFLSQILIDNKYKVGSFTSPYLIKFNERLKINNHNIKDDKLLSYINYFYSFNEELFDEFNIRLSFFEILTLMAFKYFNDEKVDVLIMEAGIGGRLDATNIIDYDVSLITSIGYDHIKQLGNTLNSIAAEKIAIVKKGGHLISAIDQPIKNDFIKYTNKVKATSKFIKRNDIFAITPTTFSYLGNLYELSLLGDYQRTNALIAVNAAQYLYNLSLDEIIPSLKKTKWAGRLEEILPGVYIDGAHNISAIEALVQNISYLFGNKKITILFSALRDKDITNMLSILKTISNNIILTSFDDFRFDSLEGFSDDKIKYIENGIATFKQLINNKQPDEIVIATGSLHFIGYLKQNN